MLYPVKRGEPVASLSICQLQIYPADKRRLVLFQKHQDGLNEVRAF